MKTSCFEIGRTPFVTIISRSGFSEALNYGHIDRFTYDPESGITLRHGRRKLCIRGARLGPLFREIAAANVTVIRAIDPEIDSVPDGEPIVEFAGRVEPAAPAPLMS